MNEFPSLHKIPLSAGREWIDAARCHEAVDRINGKPAPFRPERQRNDRAAVNPGFLCNLAMGQSAAPIGRPRDVPAKAGRKGVQQGKHAHGMLTVFVVREIMLVDRVCSFVRRTLLSHHGTTRTTLLDTVSRTTSGSMLVTNRFWTNGEGISNTGARRGSEVGSMAGGVICAKALSLVSGGCASQITHTKNGSQNNLTSDQARLVIPEAHARPAWQLHGPQPTHSACAVPRR